MKSTVRRALAVGWPAFLMAAVLEIVVFAVVDPRSLHDLAGTPLDADPMTVYSLAFLAFWCVIAVAAWLTRTLDASSYEINSRSFRR